MQELVILILTFALCSIAIDTFKNGISSLPSNPKAIEIVINEIRKTQNHHRILDLGSGFGFSALHFSKNFPESEIIAIENALIPFLFSKCLCFRKKNITLKYSNVFNEPLNNISVMYCFLYPEAMQKLSVKLKKELKNNAILISNEFRLPKYEPTKTIGQNKMKPLKVYVYHL